MVLSFHQQKLCGTQIPTIGKAKFVGLIFDSKLSFIPHITSLKSRCTKSLDLLKVLSNTTWGTDRKVLLRLYRALIRSKLDYGCIVYGSARPSYIKRLDTVHNQGLRLCLGAFRTSPVQSLYVEANEPPLDMRRTRLSLQYGVPTVCFDLCTYKKSDTDPTLYRLHYSELLESFTDYTHIFADGSKDGDKTAAAFICQSFEFS